MRLGSISVATPACAPLHAVAPCNDVLRLACGVVVCEPDHIELPDVESSENVALTLLPRLPLLLKAPSLLSWLSRLRRSARDPSRDERLAVGASCAICSWALPYSRKMTANGTRTMRGRAQQKDLSAGRKYGLSLSQALHVGKSGGTIRGDVYVGTVAHLRERD